MNEKRVASKKPDNSDNELNHLSRRKFLNIFAAGATSAVGAIVLSQETGKS